MNEDGRIPDWLWNDLKRGRGATPPWIQEGPPARIIATETSTTERSVEVGDWAGKVVTTHRTDPDEYLTFVDIETPDGESVRVPLNVFLKIAQSFYPAAEPKAAPTSAKKHADIVAAASLASLDAISSSTGHTPTELERAMINLGAASAIRIMEAEASS